jgi:Protein of unknown function DUF262
VSLESEITEATKHVATDRYSMSVGELLSLYRDGDINIHPDFQRYFRWTDFQKSRLIESLLLGLPIPPVFVSQEPSGKWELIDGLQRIATLLELFGELRGKDGGIKPQLKLTSTKYLPNLNNKVWDAEKNQGYDELPGEVKLLIRRARIDINIVLASKSDRDGKFELFDRLNTGGTVATPQEVRNCLLLMVGGGFFEWISELAADNNFESVLPLTERQKEEQFNIELVVRYLVLKSVESSEVRKIVDLHNFLTERLLSFAKDPNFNRSLEEDGFRRTFDLISRALGENAFRRLIVGQPDSRSSGPFLLAAYEVIALGLGSNMVAGTALDTVEKVSAAHVKLWRERSNDVTSVGKRASTRLGDTLAIGRELFAA